jgi:hypothetical protein
LQSNGWDELSKTRINYFICPLYTNEDDNIFLKKIRSF